MQPFRPISIGELSLGRFLGRVDGLLVLPPCRICLISQAFYLALQARNILYWFPSTSVSGILKIRTATQRPPRLPNHKAGFVIKMLHENPSVGRTDGCAYPECGGKAARCKVEPSRATREIRNEPRTGLRRLAHRPATIEPIQSAKTAL